MYNRSPYNRAGYNRSASFVFEWVSTVNATAESVGALLIIRYFDGAAEAVTTSSGEIIRTALFVDGATAEAVTDAIAEYIRHIYQHGQADAETTGSGAAVSTYGSVTMVIENVNMSPGDELIIDTEHMTVTLNGINIVDKVSDESVFFKLAPGDNDVIVEGGTTADVKILWKDRWL